MSLILTIFCPHLGLHNNRLPTANSRDTTVNIDTNRRTGTMSGRNSSLQQASGRGHPPQGGGGRGGYYNYPYQQPPPPPQQQGQGQQQGGGLRPMPPGPTGMGWQQGGGEFLCLRW